MPEDIGAVNCLRFLAGRSREQPDVVDASRHIAGLCPEFHTYFCLALQERVRDSILFVYELLPATVEFLSGDDLSVNHYIELTVAGVASPNNGT